MAYTGLAWCVLVKVSQHCDRRCQEFERGGWELGVRDVKRRSYSNYIYSSTFVVSMSSTKTIVSGVNGDKPIIDVQIRKAGPMGIRLRVRDSPPQVACLIGFDRSNGMGEIESSGIVHLGHVLIAVNDIVLLSMPFDEILKVIRLQPSPSVDAPRKLSFCSLEYIRTFQKQHPSRSIDECYMYQADSAYGNHIEYVLNCIDTNATLDYQRIRTFSQNGLPDGNNGIRSILWKVLLG